MSDYIINIPKFLREKVNINNPAIYGCSGCMTTCEVYCETDCEVCLNCETSCERATCQSSCQTNCQTLCEKNCMSGCEEVCQSVCQSVCQTCLSCQSSCQKGSSHNWVYTDWGQISGYDGCVRYKYCSKAGCTSMPIQEKKSHNYSSVGTASLCQLCSDCGKQDTKHSMWMHKPSTVINSSLHMTHRKCSKCDYIEDWSSEPHSFTEITYLLGTKTHCKRWIECPECGYGYIDETQEHVFVNNVCKFCGDEKYPFPDYNFEWEYPKIKGRQFIFDSIEYRLLVGYINQKLTFFNKANISKTTVKAGEIVYASTMNGILEGLRRLGASGVPQNATNIPPNNKITADFLNKIRDCANSIKRPS